MLKKKKKMEGRIDDCIFYFAMKFCGFKIHLYLLYQDSDSL